MGIGIRTHIIKSALLLSSVFMVGQIAEAVTVDVGGSIRPRVEYADEGIQGNAGNASKTHTTMQTRLNVKGTVDENVSAFIQIQDVRTWGGEVASAAPPSMTRTGTSVAASGLDVHQAYLVVKNVWDSGADLKVGRQEMVFDEARLIGNIGWIQQAQSFDAARLDFKAGGTGVTAFYAQTQANDTHPTMGQTIVAGTQDGHFGGLRLTWGLGEKGDRITPYYYVVNNTANGFAAPTVTIYENLNVAGVYFQKHFGNVRFRIDGAYEFGPMSPTVDVKAWMLTGALEWKTEAGNSIALWVDVLSGDNNAADTKSETFVTPYATNHKFYGHIDKFLSNPTTGLVDIALRTNWKITDSTKVEIDFHNFSSAVSAPAGGGSNLGQEIDFDINHKLAANTSLRAGYSHYFAGSKTFNGGSTGDTRVDSNWAWLMMMTKF